ncbi:MAG: glycosyltransferase family 2 protein [Phycisphaerae bacterium]|nr:glycosyltransferase family 2 protein [Phycisphaerae bacterium]
MLPLSVAIVCKNNESTIARTLESVKPLAAEIVAVDSGSTDRTIEILKSFDARVVRSPWLGFVATKQKSLEACTQPWVLALDSDESLLPTLAQSVARVLGSPSDGVDGFWMNRKVYYDDRPLNFAWQPEWRLRLVRRERASWTGLDPHDRMELRESPGGVVPRTEKLRGDMRHDSIAGFSEFLVKQASHARTMAISMKAEGHKGSVLKLLTSPVGAFVKQAVFKQSWRDGWPGVLAAASTAAGTLMKHAILIELNRRKVR